MFARKEAQSRIRTNLNEKLNKKKRRPTEAKGNTAGNVAEYTSSINTEDSNYSEDENENAFPEISSGYTTMSHEQRSSTDTAAFPTTKPRGSENSTPVPVTSNNTDVDKVLI